MGHRYVGIDVSKKRLEVVIRVDGAQERAFHVSNTPGGCRSLVKQLSKDPPSLVAVEATGGYERQAWAMLGRASIPVVVMNPQRAKAFAQFKGRLSKTDTVDATTLSLIAEQGRLEPTPLPDSETEALKAVVARRRQVVAMLTMEKNRLRQVSESIAPGVKRHIMVLTHERNQLDREIRQAIEQNPVWQERAKLLRTIKGIGPVTCAVILACLPEAGSLQDKKLAALVGVAPFAWQSGTKDGKRFIRGGRGPVRHALYMAALSAIRSNPQIRQFHRRLIERSKPKKVAIVACMHKLLRIANAVLRRRVAWNPDWRHDMKLAGPPTTAEQRSTSFQTGEIEWFGSYEAAHKTDILPDRSISPVDAVGHVPNHEAV